MEDTEAGTSRRRKSYTLSPEEEFEGCGNSCLQFRLEGSIICHIFRPIILIMIYTIIIICLHNYAKGFEMNFPLSLVPVLGVTVGLLLVFRTNTAYDRFWEGRKLWSQVNSNIRSLTLSIWVGIEEKEKEVKGPRDFKRDHQWRPPTPQESLSHSHSQSHLESTAEGIVGKVTAINLLVGFAYATKHYLRGEYGYDEEDMKDFVKFLSKRTPQAEYSTNRPKSKMGDKSDRLMAYDYITPSNIPLEITYHLFSYLTEINKKGQVDRKLMRDMQKSVMTLINCLTDFERVLRTPMPVAYGVHLNYTVWLYLLALPFQFAGTLNWWTVPAVTVTAFAFLGILAIGVSIENPFGHEDNDLPLDDFCKVIQREAQLIVAHPMPPMESWLMSFDNRPLVPISLLSAKDLSKKTSQDIKTLLTARAGLPWSFPVF